MKVVVAGLLLISFDRSRAFTSYTICSHSKKWISNEAKGKTTCFLASATEESDQYDDYYDELDPSKFDGDDQEDTSSSSKEADHGYNLAADAGPNQSSLSEPEIHQMLATRRQHWLINDYTTANRIWRDLRKAGVEVNDKRREWRADGLTFNDAIQTYVQSKFSTSTENAGEIQALVDERAKARAGRLFRKADEIRVLLFRKYHVSINDKFLEWSVGAVCLGPNGHRYNLAPDAGPNRSTLSEPEIHQMLSTRLQHKLIRDFSTASRIAKDLENAGVRFSETRREWRADGVLFTDIASTYVQSKLSKSAPNAGEIQALVDERAQAWAARLSKKADEISVALFRQFDVLVNDNNLEWSVGSGCFGPNGHDYNLAADAGPIQSPLSEPEIHKMLATRLQCKLMKDFRMADKIRKDLRKAGVLIDDRRREWRADSGFFYTGIVAKYVQSELSTSTADAAEIQALVDERARAQAGRLFKKADDIRDVLFRQFDVNVDDSRMEWSVGGACFGPYGHDYAMAADAGPNISTLSEPEIHQMLATRRQHWLIKDYKASNKIQKDLADAGVEVYDRRREWRADGVTFSVVAPKYVQSKLSTSTADADKIQLLVDERAQAWAARLTEKVDEINVVLFRQFDVLVNDNNLEWSVGGGCFGPNGHDYNLAADAGPIQSPLSEPEIHKMLATRFQHRLIKDFNTADKLRKDLRKAGVEVNDDRREWRAGAHE